MPIVTIFSGDFCGSTPLIKKIGETIEYKLLTDDDIAALASKRSGISEHKIKTAFSAKTSVFNRFTHEKEHSMAWLKLAVAEMLSQDNLMFVGVTGQMIPKSITHVLRVCLIADMKFRVNTAMKEQGLSEKEAIHLIHKQDEDKAAWIESLFKTKDPWDSSLYDIVIPTDKMGEIAILKLVEDNLRSEVIKPTASSLKTVQDFVLAVKTEIALIREGHTVDVSARDGAITLTVNKHVLMLNRLEEELKAIAGKVEGVKSVETRVGKGFHKADIYRRYDFEMPSKVLLVDDEREFVQTLSERLLMRDMGSVVRYDGESALDLVKEEEPDVMILDLKMPGIDGIEVLKRVKQTNPDMEVVILTGHGSEADRETCMKLGAFAYLNKPVNIELLSQTIKKAHEKIAKKRGK